MIQSILKCQNCHAPLTFTHKTTLLIKCECCGSDNVLATKAREAARKHEHSYLVVLRKELEAQFSLEDTRLLVFNMNSAAGVRIDFDDLPSGGKKGKQLALIQWCQRRNLIPQLTEMVVGMRPALAIALP